jgi:hypothetical protein
MKKYIALCFTVFVISQPGFSQVGQPITTTLVVNQPSSTLSEWTNNNATITFIVTKLGIVPLRVIIKAELKLTDGTVIATKDLSKAQVFTLQEGTRIFFAKDVLPLEITLFTGTYKSTLEKTGKLPSGTYQLSVQLVEPGTFAAITPLQNRIFNLTSPQLPFLIAPVNNTILDARKSETSIIFRWTPLIPRQRDQPIYRLQVFEILPYQQPLQALRGNQPLLDKQIQAQTQFIWRPQISFSTDSIPKKFIWTIQTLDSKQQPIIQTSGNGESRSEPFMFIVSKTYK